MGVGHGAEPKDLRFAPDSWGFWALVATPGPLSGGREGQSAPILGYMTAAHDVPSVIARLADELNAKIAARAISAGLTLADLAKLRVTTTLEPVTEHLDDNTYRLTATVSLVPVPVQDVPLPPLEVEGGCTYRYPFSGTRCGGDEVTHATHGLSHTYTEET